MINSVELKMFSPAVSGGFLGFWRFFQREWRQNDLSCCCCFSVRPCQKAFERCCVSCLFQEHGDGFSSFAFFKGSSRFFHVSWREIQENLANPRQILSLCILLCLYGQRWFTFQAFQSNFMMKPLKLIWV